MSLFNVMSISSTGMEAENVRLNTTASNIANANTVSSSYDQTYRARHPVFATELQQAMQDQSKGAGGICAHEHIMMIEAMESRDEFDREWDGINDSISDKWNRIVWSTQEMPW